MQRYKEYQENTLLSNNNNNNNNICFHFFKGFKI